MTVISQHLPRQSWLRHKRTSLEFQFVSSMEAPPGQRSARSLVQHRPVIPEQAEECQDEDEVRREAAKRALSHCNRQVQLRLGSPGAKSWPFDSFKIPDFNSCKSNSSQAATYDQLGVGMLGNKPVARRKPSLLFQRGRTPSSKRPLTPCSRQRMRLKRLSLPPVFVKFLQD